MAERHAPAGKVWMCGMCGKKCRDRYGEEGGWDESCMLNAYLVDEANPVLDPVMVQADWERRVAESMRRCDEFRESFANGTWVPDPELLALAEQVIREKDAREGRTT